jgi:prepilin-type N-terminal cleavage/methylation domain-containing protein
MIAGVRRSHGFTIIEVLLVVFLFGLMTAAFAPRVGKVLAFAINDSADEMEAELQYASERAVTTGEAHRLVFDLERQRFRLEHEVDKSVESEDRQTSRSGRIDLSPPIPTLESEPVQGLRGEWRRFRSDDVRIARVIVGGERYERDLASIAFQGDGSADAA